MNEEEIRQIIMSQDRAIGLLTATVNDLWTEHHGGYHVTPDDPNRDAIIAAGKARIAWIESMRTTLAEAAVRFPSTAAMEVLS